MKRFSLVLFIVLLILNILCSCDQGKKNDSQTLESDNTSNQNESFTKEEWYDEYINTAITKVKQMWQIQYSSNDGEHLEIKNTRIISIKSNQIEEFKDIKYIVEFVLFTEYYHVAPYYYDESIYDAVVFYQNGDSEVVENNPFKAYRSKYYINDFSEIIREICDLGSKYNDTFKLSKLHDGTTEGVVCVGTIKSNSKFHIKDSAGNIVITNADIEKVFVCYSSDVGYSLNVEMTDEGTEKFRIATNNNLGKQLPIYNGDTLICMPTVNDVITDGTAVITGSYDFETVMKMFMIFTN